MVWVCFLMTLGLLIVLNGWLSRSLAMMEQSNPQQESQFGLWTPNEDKDEVFSLQNNEYGLHDNSKKKEVLMSHC